MEYVYITASPFVVLVSIIILLYRLSYRRQATIVTGVITDNVYRPMSPFAGAKIKLSTGKNKGKSFISITTFSFFGHRIDKTVNVYEFDTGGDYVFKVASTYLLVPSMFLIIFSFIGLLGLWVW